MTDNKIQADARAKDGQIIERAQNRLKKAHSLKKRGGWRGYRLLTITHPEFGKKPIQVFAIDVSVPA